jgi:hypothetical protein
MNEDTRKERSIAELRDERGRFGPGNPGRPRGARNRVTAAAEAIINDAIGDVAQKAVELALAGDVGCIRAVLRLRLPALRDHSVQEPIELPALAAPKDAVAALRIIAEAAARGEIDGDHARLLVAVIDGPGSRERNYWKRAVGCPPGRGAVVGSRAEPDRRA